MIPYNTILSDSIITLRSTSLDEASELVAAVQESFAEIMPWMGWCTPDYNEDTALNWLASLPDAWQEGRQYSLVICDS
jgi:hypothetical protein